MNKKKLIMVVLGGLAVGSVIAAGIFFFVLNTDSKETTPPDAVSDAELLSPTPIVPSASARSYENSAGFTFEHPADVSIEELELTESSYADISLISTRAQGSISIRITDSELDSIDEWVASKGLRPEDPPANDIKLGDVAGKEVVAGNTIEAAILDEGALFLIHVNSDEQMAYWTDVYHMLVDSFAFITPEATSASSTESTGEGAAVGDDILFEGEEIIE